MTVNIVSGNDHCYQYQQETQSVSDTKVSLAKLILCNNSSFSSTILIQLIFYYSLYYSLLHDCSPNDSLLVDCICNWSLGMQFKSLARRPLVGLNLMTCQSLCLHSSPPTRLKLRHKRTMESLKVKPKTALKQSLHSLSLM